MKGSGNVTSVIVVMPGDRYGGTVQFESGISADCARSAVETRPVKRTEIKGRMLTSRKKINRRRGNGMADRVVRRIRFRGRLSSNSERRAFSFPAAVPLRLPETPPEAAWDTARAAPG